MEANFNFESTSVNYKRHFKFSEEEPGKIEIQDKNGKIYKYDVYLTKDGKNYTPTEDEWKEMTKGIKKIIKTIDRKNKSENVLSKLENYSIDKEGVKDKTKNSTIKYTDWQTAEYAPKNKPSDKQSEKILNIAEPLFKALDREDNKRAIYEPKKERRELDAHDVPEVRKQDSDEEGSLIRKRKQKNRVGHTGDADSPEPATKKPIDRINERVFEETIEKFREKNIEMTNWKIKEVEKIHANAIKKPIALHHEKELKDLITDLKKIKNDGSKESLEVFEKKLKDYLEKVGEVKPKLKNNPLQKFLTDSKKSHETDLDNATIIKNAFKNGEIDEKQYIIFMKKFIDYACKKDVLIPQNSISKLFKDDLKKIEEKIDKLMEDLELACTENAKRTSKINDSEREEVKPVDEKKNEGEAVKETPDDNKEKMKKRLAELKEEKVKSELADLFGTDGSGLFAE